MGVQDHVTHSQELEVWCLLCLGAVLLYIAASDDLSRGLRGCRMVSEDERERCGKRKTYGDQIEMFVQVALDKVVVTKSNATQRVLDDFLLNDVKGAHKMTLV